MEKIIEKLQKIKALADSGEVHEAQAARRRLELLLVKYGVSMDELEEPGCREYRMEYGKPLEFHLLVAVLMKCIGEERVKELKMSKSAKTLFLQVTPCEYAEVKNMLDWHMHNYRVERRKVLKDLEIAYMIRHGLNMPSLNDGEGTPKKELSQEEKKRMASVLGMCSGMSDKNYHKALEKK